MARKKEEQEEETEEFEDSEEATEDENSEEAEEESEESEEESTPERQMFKAVCTECGKDCEVPFEPEEGKPVRCQDCFRRYRSNRRPFGGNNSGGRRFGGDRGGSRNRFDNRRPREMHKAKCAQCGNNCEVPFKPTEGKPVLCGDCYRKSKGFN